MANTPYKTGYFFTPFSSTSWGQRWRDQQGQFHWKLNAQSPGAGAHYLAPQFLAEKYKMPGFNGAPPKDADGRPINPRDAGYFLNASGLRYQLQNQMMPLQRQMDLLDNRYGGQTMFQLLDDRRRRDARVEKDTGYTSLAARGVFNSGLRDNLAGNLMRKRADGRLALDQQWGEGARTNLRNEMSDLRRQNGNQMLQYLLAAMAAKKQLSINNTLGA